MNLPNFKFSVGMCRYLLYGLLVLALDVDLLFEITLFTNPRLLCVVLVKWLYCAPIQEVWATVSSLLPCIVLMPYPYCSFPSAVYGFISILSGFVSVKKVAASSCSGKTEGIGEEIYAWSLLIAIFSNLFCLLASRHYFYKKFLSCSILLALFYQNLIFLA